MTLFLFIIFAKHFNMLSKSSTQVLRLLINILNLLIDVNLIFIDSFKHLNDYRSYLSGEYKLISKFDDFERPLFSSPKEENKLFDTYELDNKIYQYHKNNNQPSGIIPVMESAY